MFSTSWSPQPPSACPPRPGHPVHRLPPLSSTVSLPTGECRFIFLHPSIPDQRCACQGFHRDESLLGAYCQCGHQACYHLQGNVAIPPPADDSVTSVSYVALLDRIRSLEAQYQRDKKIWEEELKEERRARREDVRVLREAMYSFFQFMEQDVPRQFVDIEDKIESIVDRQQQLHERVITVDDSSMILEDRIAELEKVVSREIPDRAERENDHEEEDDMDEAGKLDDETSVVDHRSPVGAQRSCTRDRNPGSPHSVKTQVSVPSPSPTHSPPFNRSLPPIRSDNGIAATEDGEHSKYCQDLPALTRSLTSPVAARTRRDIIPERQLLIQAIRHCDCDSRIDANSGRSSHQQLNSSPSEIEEKPCPSPSSSPSPFALQCSDSRSPCTVARVVPGKRKGQAKDERPGRAWTLPNPPPFSLSDSSVDSMCCKGPRSS
ncbi:hypothetical protein VTN77DRAFT_59 [Rasamsonia byssochlamydoides]|uniref:uncharacterized protein n=1 Tax=Rasamsonia byssochlamydoides TaxID=89139 RepID=UPI0037430B3E